MNAKTLRDFLEGRDFLEKLKKEMSIGVNLLRKNLNKKGYSSPVYFYGDGTKFVIHHQHVRNLFESFMAGEIDEVEMCYIATAIELSEDFSVESEELEDILSILAEDPDLSKPKSKKEIQEIYDSLK